jgi:WD40 repeat protein
VWEWQSETYVMKQQGHFNNMTCFAYSPDGQYIVTGGEDGKVSCHVAASLNMSTVQLSRMHSSV